MVRLKMLSHSYTSLAVKSAHQTMFPVPLLFPLATVTLHFAEMFLLLPNLRRFNVWIEDEFAFSSVDMVDESGRGSSRKAMAITKTVIVEDKKLMIEFEAINRDPYISAIEVQGVPDAQNVPPTEAPIVVPAPTDVPIRYTDISPTMAPPINTQSTDSPTQAPSTLSPTTDAPTASLKTPAPTDAPVEPQFEGVRINAGGDQFVDFLGNVWLADQYFSGGDTYADGSKGIAATQDDLIYQTERYGTCHYEIPLPVANYEVRIHLAEIYFDSTNARKFDIEIEGETAFKNVDIVALALGESRKAMTLEKPQLVTDGFLSISFLKSNQSVDNPKVAAIEVKLVEDHLAHAVANGPYVVTDTDDCEYSVGVCFGQPVCGTSHL